MSKVIKDLYCYAYTRDGIRHWSMTDGREGSEPVSMRMDDSHPMFQADTFQHSFAESE